MDEIRIWGTPWQPSFYDWAFNAPRRDGEAFLASKFDAIPADTDIIVAHGNLALATAVVGPKMLLPPRRDDGP